MQKETPRTVAYVLSYGHMRSDSVSRHGEIGWKKLDLLFTRILRGIITVFFLKKKKPAKDLISNYVTLCFKTLALFSLVKAADCLL